MSAAARPEENRGPVAMEAEWGVLGAALRGPTALDAARDILTADDFAGPVNRSIFAAMCERRDAGEPIDVQLVRFAIGDQDLGGATVSEYLARLWSNAPAPEDAVGYARTVRHAADMRRVLETSRTGVEAMSVAAIKSPARFAAGMIEALDQIAVAAAPTGVQRLDLGEASALAVEAMHEARAGQRKFGVPYGISSIDHLTLGMRPGQLIILAGRPGMGKSSAGVSIALSTARAGYGAYFVSLEMVAQELAERALAAEAYDPRGPIAYRRIVSGRDLTDSEVARIEEAHERIRNYPLKIEQQAGLTISQIAARARNVRAQMERRGSPLSVMFIDHLGLVAASKRYSGQRVQEISEITGATKVLAKELGIPIVLLSQLSRGNEQRPIMDRRPILTDLRDSGSIEQDADVVIGLFRAAYYLDRKADRTEEEEALFQAERDVLEAEILKQRQGPTGRTRLFCSMECNVISELA